VQRLWRLVNEAGEIGRDAPAARPAQFSPAARIIALRARIKPTFAMLKLNP